MAISDAGVTESLLWAEVASVVCIKHSQSSNSVAAMVTSIAVIRHHRLILVVMVISALTCFPEVATESATNVALFGV